MNKPRIPQQLRDRLAVIVDTLDKGPSMDLDKAHFGESEEFMAGSRDVKRRYAQWNEYNVTARLRQLLAWADGEHSVHDITTYDLGTEYKP